MMSSFSGREGRVPVPLLVASAGRAIDFDASCPSSTARAAPVVYGVVESASGCSGSWEISRVYGSMSSLFGSNRLPCASTSLTKPALEPLVHDASWVQLGPQAR
jgi:hypothetical protein